MVCRRVVNKEVWRASRLPGCGWIGTRWWPVWACMSSPCACCGVCSALASTGIGDGDGRFGGCLVINLSRERRVTYSGFEALCLYLTVIRPFFLVSSGFMMRFTFGLVYMYILSMHS